MWDAPPAYASARLWWPVFRCPLVAGFEVSTEVMHLLKADATTPPARSRARRYFNCGLLIIDEVGFRPLDRIEANLFFRLVSIRYERGSILLTSNKHVRDWPEIFAGDEILTTAILDRLLHHVAVIHIDGQSYRLREFVALLGPTRTGQRADSPRSNQPPESAGIFLCSRCGSLAALQSVVLFSRRPCRMGSTLQPNHDIANSGTTYSATP